MTDVTVHHLVATIMAVSIVMVMFVVVAMSVVACVYSDVVPWRELLVVVREGLSGRPQISHPPHGCSFMC